MVGKERMQNRGKENGMNEGETKDKDEWEEISHASREVQPSRCRES